MVRRRIAPLPLARGIVGMALVGAACTEPDAFLPPSQAGGPAGVIDGALTYSGALPCTAGGHVVGAAVLFAFDERLLPPPDGIGTTAASLAVVTGDALFAGVRDRLTFEPSGGLWCPDAKAAPATVTGAWAIAPLPAGTYQIRGFYDRDGDFDPGFVIANLPSRGDVGGGAIDNVADVLQGKPPAYRAIGLGELQENGARAIPEAGARVEGVAVTLGLTLEAERPIFHVAEVIAPAGAKQDPGHVELPSDFQLAIFDSAKAAATEQSFLRIRLGAGVPKGEAEVAAAAPFGFPTASPTFLVTRQDVDENGTLDGKDHVPDSALIPSLYPLSIFSRLSEGSGASQAAPVVLLQGITIADSLVSTALSAATIHATKAEIVVALRPSVLCLDPLDATKRATLLVTHATDKAGNKVVGDEKALTAALGAQFGRTVEVAYGCLPEGRYAMNLVYGTGQAWTTPNEAGVCAPSEAPSGGGLVCGTRARLPSQAAVLTIGAPIDPAYCAKHAMPAACRR